MLLLAIAAKVQLTVGAAVLVLAIPSYIFQLEAACHPVLQPPSLAESYALPVTLLVLLAQAQLLIVPRAQILKSSITINVLGSVLAIPLCWSLEYARSVVLTA